MTGGKPKHVLTVNGYSGGEKKAELTVNIAVTNYNEQPVSTQNTTTNRAPVWYLSEDDSESILISSVFMDPEGSPVYFNGAAGSTDVYVCDNNTAGDTSPASSTATANARAATPDGAGAITAGTGGTGTTACSVSNENAGTISADGTTRTAPATGADNGGAGMPGNRVVTTRKVGPILHITANSLVTDDDDDAATVGTTARGSGTYTAKVLFRIWTGADGVTAEGPTRQLASSNWSMATVHVKVGANNLPQFAGGATGFNAEMQESDGATSAAPMPADAWNAGDLDIAEVDYSDALRYKLEGQFFLAAARREVVLRAGGIVWVNQPTTAAPNVTLGGFGIDYEDAQSFTVNLQVTDEWSDYVSVPIMVAVKNVNELEFAKDGDDDKLIKPQRLIQGGKRTFDLDDYFVDPEGDEITFSAHTNIYTNVASVGEGNVLTITGANTSASDPESEVTVTVVASDGKITLPHNFMVTTRFTNKLPTIDLVEDGTIAIGASVDENGAVGEEVVTVEFDDDDPAATPHLTGSGSDNFKATVNDDNDEVAITVAKSLNFEASDRHTLKLVLQDAWDDTKMSEPLEIQVSVVDQNDAPPTALRT